MGRKRSKQANLLVSLVIADIAMLLNSFILSDRSSVVNLTSGSKRASSNTTNNKAALARATKKKILHSNAQKRKGRRPVEAASSEPQTAPSTSAHIDGHAVESVVQDQLPGPAMHSDPDNDRDEAAVRTGEMIRVRGLSPAPIVSNTTLPQNTSKVNELVRRCQSLEEAVLGLREQRQLLDERIKILASQLANNAAQEKVIEDLERQAQEKMVKHIEDDLICIS